MNKQEVIKALEEKKSDFNAYEHLVRNRAFDESLTIIRELDEPEKTVVPQFIADYIASEQCSYSTLSEAIDNMDDEKEVLCWSYDNSETFAKAWLFGYEVEKEKLYTVELPNPNGGGHVILCKTSDGTVSITFASMARWRGCRNVQLTESEVKEDFDWAWEFAKEVEDDTEI